MFTFFNVLSKEEDDHEIKAHEIQDIDIAVKKSTKVKLNDGNSSKSQTPSGLSDYSSVVKNYLNSKKLTKPEVLLGDGKFVKEKLLLSTWNVNGIRQISNKGQLQDYLKTHNVDILCLNESKVDEESFVYENVASQIPEGYFHYWNFCKIKKGYSGVGVLSKVKPISVSYDMGIEKHDSEGRVITLEFEKFFLVAVYVPNVGDMCKRLKYRCEDWEPDFRKFLAELRKKKPTILAGDLNVAQHNIDVYNPRVMQGKPSFTNEERTEFELLLKDGWSDAYRKLNPGKAGYTFYGYFANKFKRENGLRIDYFMCCKDTIPLAVHCEPRAEVMGSDHVPLHLHFEIGRLVLESQQSSDSLPEPLLREATVGLESTS